MKVEGLEAANANVTRLRLGLEGTCGRESGATAAQHSCRGRRWGFATTGAMRRRDSASTSGAGCRGRIRAADSRERFTHVVSSPMKRVGSASRASPARSPSTHPESERGFSVTLSQSMGAQASGGMDALLGRGTLEGLGANDAGDGLANRRLELKAGYGFGVAGGRFTATPEAGMALSDNHREMSLGWRLALSGGAPVSMELGLEATRREAANDVGAPEHAVGLRMTARW